MSTDSKINNTKNDTINICICIGQICNSSGSKEILKEIRKIKEKHHVKIDLTLQNCFSRCENENGLCPTLKIRNLWVDNATPAKVRDILTQIT